MGRAEKFDEDRRTEIRRMAYEWAARELSEVTNVWEVPERLFDNETERAVFDSDVAAIVNRLAARGDHLAARGGRGDG